MHAWGSPFYLPRSFFILLEVHASELAGVRHARCGIHPKARILPLLSARWESGREAPCPAEILRETAQAC